VLLEEEDDDDDEEEEEEEEDALDIADFKMDHLTDVDFEELIINFKPISVACCKNHSRDGFVTLFISTESGGRVFSSENNQAQYSCISGVNVPLRYKCSLPLQEYFHSVFGEVEVTVVIFEVQLRQPK